MRESLTKRKCHGYFSIKIMHPMMKLQLDTHRHSWTRQVNKLIDYLKGQKTANSQKALAITQLHNFLKTAI